MWTKHIGVRVFHLRSDNEQGYFLSVWVDMYGVEDKAKNVIIWNVWVRPVLRTMDMHKYISFGLSITSLPPIYRFQIILQTMLKNEGVRQPFIYLSFCWSFYNENYQEKARSSFGCQHYTSHHMDQMATPWIRVNAIPPCWRIILKWLAWICVYSVWILSCHNITEQMSA